MFTCKSGKHEGYTWNLENETLKQEILNYIDSVDVPSVKDKFVMITFRHIDYFTVVYELRYCINSYGLSTTDFSPHLFFYVDKNLVCLRVKGMYEFALDSAAVIDIMKSRFPEQYQYYLEVGYLPPPITAREVTWILTFKNGELIN
jgi:hypothetical protein